MVFISQATAEGEELIWLSPPAAAVAAAAVDDGDIRIRGSPLSLSRPASWAPKPDAKGPVRDGGVSCSCGCGCDCTVAVAVRLPNRAICSNCNFSVEKKEEMDSKFSEPDLEIGREVTSCLDGARATKHGAMSPSKRPLQVWLAHKTSVRGATCALDTADIAVMPDISRDMGCAAVPV